ncbi:MAG: hypothetical protein ALECFALPRED_008311 [Alectoria fallacina]|uniref:SAP domain-containing protein n=1 Tax=Alectoria fallacina TaxID=1903189 RepID=A0A8H3EWR0_9LECA|nr:MAG: hypothetical protein ALECFALPRED_008311 [Alectoria fallacina]
MVKGRPAYGARSAKNDPPVVFPNLHPLASWQDGRKFPKTITTITDDEACIQKNRVEPAKARKINAQGLDNNEARFPPTRPVPTSTRHVHAHVTAASSAKRKLDRTSLESLPVPKRIHSPGKDVCEKRSEPETADKYKYLSQSHVRKECLSRSLPVDGSNQDLIKRPKLYDAARAQIPISQEHVEEDVTFYTSSRAEPQDRYTHMLQKDLRKECLKCSLPVGMAKPDLRRCLRLYDAARALGLTPEESLEAQKATFQYSIEDHAQSVSPRGSIEEITFRTASDKAVEGHTLSNTSREFIVDDGQLSDFPEADYFPSLGSQAPSENRLASSSSTTRDYTQDGSTSSRCPGAAATLNYAAMGQTELRSLCRSRSLKQNSFSGPQLRRALKSYDKKMAKQANNAEVEVDAEHQASELGVAPCLSPPPVAFIDLDSSTQDGENPGQRTRSMVTGAAISREEPASGYLWAVNKHQRPSILTDAQVESTDRASAGILIEKDPYTSPYSPHLVLKTPTLIGNESHPRTTPFKKGPVPPQQPLVSLLNLAIKDTWSGASKSAQQETQTKTKPLSEHAIKVAEKEEFNTRYANEDPSWICCCGIPGDEIRPKKLAKFSGNCFYHVSHLAQRGNFTMKEYQEYQISQQALDRIASCLCQKPAVDHSQHRVTMTQGGFILAQIWREQLTRRESLTSFRPDMATYRRKGILEVMHNVLEDFTIELSSRQQERPLVLWARMEAMAWFINTLPTSNDWHCFQDWTRPSHYIMLFGIALLTTIDALLKQKLFKDNEPKVPNIGLVLALFLQSTWNLPNCTMNSSHSKDVCKSPFNNDICVNNENGWAAEVISLADQHGVRIEGVKNIDLIVDQWRLRKKSFESMRDQTRKEQYAILQNGEIVPPSEATLTSTAAKTSEIPAKRGTGQPVTVRAFRASTGVVRCILASE